MTAVQLNWLDKRSHKEIVKAHFDDEYEDKTDKKATLHVINMLTGNFPIKWVQIFFLFKLKKCNHFTIDNIQVS